jgi:hypothetical protein
LVGLAILMTSNDENLSGIFNSPSVVQAVQFPFLSDFPLTSLPHPHFHLFKDSCLAEAV